MRSFPPDALAHLGRARSAVEMLGVESLVLKTGRRSSAVVTRGVESLRLLGREAQAGLTKAAVVSSGPGGWLLR